MWHGSIRIAVALLKVRGLPLDFIFGEKILKYTDLLEAGVDYGTHGGVESFVVADVVALVFGDEVFEVPGWVVDPADFVDVVMK